MFFKKGLQNINVTYWKYDLRILCINPDNIDNTFGNDTYNNVKRFQSRFSLTTYGIVGDNT